MRNGAPGRRTLDERLARKTLVAKVSDLVDDECWLWQGAITGSTRGGYGQIKVGGGSASPSTVHRLAYEREHGPVPEGLQLDHVCNVRNCWRPSHLEAVTQSENQRRGYERRRRLRDAA